MNIKAAIFALITASAASVCAAAPSKAELKAAYEAADVVLKDDSFYKSWEASPEISSVEEAEEMIARTEELGRRLDEALEAQKAYCRTKFFENSCTEDAVQLVNERRRELRKVEVAARDAVRRANTAEIKKKRAEEASKPAKKPVEYSPRLKAPAEPIDYVPRTVREKSAPMDLAPKQVKEASKPEPLDPKTIENVDEAQRRALEEQNLEYYEAKQREAAERKAQADERAQKRREERLERQKRFAETLKEREEAQKRYEEKMQNKDSGISRFLPGFE